MILAQQRDHILRVGAFGKKPGEAAQVAKQSRDLAAMAFQLLLGPRRDDQVGDLRRQKTPQPAHALDLADLVGDARFELRIELDNLFSALPQLIEQAGVLDGDHRLRSEVLQQRDLLVGERPNFLAVDGQGPEQHFVLA